MEILFCLVIVLNIGFTQAAVPTFTAVTSPISVLENTPTETSLDTFTVTDPDGGSISSCSHTGDSGEFDIRQNSGNVYELFLVGSAGLNHGNTPMYTLVITCTDSSSESASVSIQVDITPNQPPTLTAPSGTYSVSENEEAQRLIYTLTVTDPETDTFSCAITPSPNTAAFGIWKDPTDYAVYLNNNPGITYAAATSYDITLNCSDAFGYSTQTLTVDITPNEAPTFSSTPYTATFDASMVGIGNTVFTVTASDTDSTTLTFTMTANPPSPTFFQIDPVTGEITATQDLIYTVDNVYDLTVTVSDSEASTTETARLTLTNVNTAPIINLLPDTVYLDENSPSGTVIYTLQTSDPDAGDPENVTFTLSVSGYIANFDYNSTTRQLTIANDNALDFEELNTYNFYFTISDNKAETGPYTLTLRVNDVNERCNFSSEAYHATMYEANSGYGDSDPGFIVTDDDDGSSFSLSLETTTESSYFSVDSTTGIIQFAVNYDVDGTHPNNVTLVCKCTDDKGATSTATLSLTILDINDNTPEFGSTGYIYYSDQYDKAGETVATIAATDIDSGDNGDVEYEWVAVGAGSTRYELNSNGAVILLVNPNTMSYGDTYEFLVTATDQGSPRRSSTTTVHMVYREVTTTTVTTTTTQGNATKSDFWDDDGNVTFVVIAILLALVIMALLAYLFWKYLYQSANPCTTRENCCKPKPKRRKVNSKPKTGKTPFDFWHETEFMKRQRQPREIRPTGLPFTAPPE